MKIQRTIPPAAAPVDWRSLLHGVAGFAAPKRYLNLLETELKEYFSVKHVFLISSGKAALTVILKALHSLEPQKQEVIIPAYTCFSVPSAIVKAGLKVSLCDVVRRSFDFDYAELPMRVTDNTLCIVANHLFGISADIEKIRALCRERNLYLIEDAAQAIGVRRNGRLLGSISDVAFFSLGRGKNVTCGSGGIIVTNDDQIADAIGKIHARLEGPRWLESIADYIKVLLTELFIRPDLYWFPAGLPFLKLGETVFEHEFPIERLSGMKAGLMRNWQVRLNKSNSARQKNALLLLDMLDLQLSVDPSVPFIRLPLLMASKKMRDDLFMKSREKGLGFSRMYLTPINEIPEMNEHAAGRVFPAAREVADCLLSLPTHQLLSRRDKAKICRCIMAQRQLAHISPATSESSSHVH